MYIENGRSKFYQWDINQRLVIENEFVTEVHYTNAVTKEALVCEVYEENGIKVADVPNILLQESWSINAFGACSLCTREAKTFDVESRAKPADYVYTETQLITIESEVKKTLEEELPAAVEAEVAKTVPAEVEKALPIGNVCNAIRGSFTGDTKQTFVNDASELKHEVTIKNKLGFSEVSVYRENYIPSNAKYKVGESTTNNGVTFTDKGNGLIIANGKNDGNGTSNYYIYDGDLEESIPKGNYLIYGIGIDGKEYSSEAPFRTRLTLADTNGEKTYIECNRNKRKVKFTLNAPATFLQYGIRVSQGVSVENQRFYTLLLNEDTKEVYKGNGHGIVKIDSSPTIVALGNNILTIEYNKDINKVLEKIESLLGGVKI